MTKSKIAVAFSLATVIVLAGAYLTASAYQAGQSVPGLICLRDDSSPRMLRINTSDGSFRYENCEFGTVLMGQGTLVTVNQTLVLSANGVSAAFGMQTNAGTASIQEFNGSPSTINDTDTTNSGCICPEL